ncbi:hypothetical protein ASC89_06610 [Devosia sp. Root413D1]|uniref:methylamine utilization protein MauJ n=1 Tax=Devosia sp. Root413D1 TaxID=1736531 RepID=UPI0006F8CB9B|nr:methylamine utilization protein MauJ [Devosia sp. Root413D1]KQW81483.1 hypothetical protein ASC89_06610 [Devosia sp. Root413D1]
MAEATATKRYLAAFHLKTALRLADGQGRVEGQHAGTQVYITNVPRKHGEAYFLDLRFLLDATDLEAAETVASETAEEIAHTLSFVSALSVRVERSVFLIDWEPGLKARDQYVYGHYPIIDPRDALDNTMWATVQAVSEHEVTAAKRSALRWHTRAARAATYEDQFLYYFFAIEILAASETFAGKVVDKCPSCRGDLTCPNPDCGRPEHKPFPKQKIGLLLTEMGVNATLIDALLDLRNLLSHGEERKQINRHMQKYGPDFELRKAVERMEELSSTAIHRALALPEFNPPLQFYFLEEPENVTVTPRAHTQIGLAGNPNEPNVYDVWMPQLSVIVTDPKTGEQETIPVGGDEAHLPAKSTD